MASSTCEGMLIADLLITYGFISKDLLIVGFEDEVLLLLFGKIVKSTKGESTEYN